MHGMISAERQFGDDGFGCIFRHDRIGGKCISYDSVVDLRINRSLIQADACATSSACLDGLAAALNHVCFSSAGLVFESHQKSAIMWLTEVVVVPRPSVDVNHSGRPHYEVASVTNVVCKYGRATARGQRQSAVTVG